MIPYVSELILDVCASSSVVSIGVNIYLNYYYYFYGIIKA